MVEREDVLAIIVADGTTSSLYAAEAAEFITGMIDHFALRPSTALIDHARDGLLELRKAAAARPITISASVPEAIREHVLAAALDKVRSSHQSTLMAVRAECHPYAMLLSPVQCGDSALLVYGRDGRLFYSTTPLRRSQTEQGKPPRLSFVRSGSLTAVLPEQADVTMVWEAAIAVEPTSVIVVTSDGLVDAFDGPEDLWAWIRGPGVDPIVDVAGDIHARLQARRGDDDVSFVIAWRTDVE